jgi:ComF family protein
MKLALKEKLLNTLFPPLCIACKRDRMPFDAASALLCAACTELVTPIPTLHCPVCRRRLPLDSLSQPKSLRCHPNSSHLVFSAASYEQSVIQSLILELKFKRRASIANLLSGLVVEACSNAGIALNNFLIVPLPLSAARLRNRGFNQAELIAHAFSKSLNLPVQLALARVKHCRPQSEISTWTQRQINISGAFELTGQARIDGKNIALIDDVWTSGATLSEAVSVLKNAGACEVVAVVAARAGA